MVSLHTTTKTFTNRYAQSLGRVAMTRKLVMTTGLHNRYEGRGISTRCRRCQELIEVGEAFISKNSCHSRTVLYHESCWHALFFDDEKVEEELIV